MEHWAAAPFREAVAIEVDDIHVARTCGDALGQDGGALVDQGQGEPIDNFVITDSAPGDLPPRCNVLDQRRDLGVGMAGARCRVVTVVAGAGFLAKALHFHQGVGQG